MRILLVCNEGMSTGIMELKLKEEIKKDGRTDEVEAVPMAFLPQNVDNAGVILLGPQIRFAYEEVKAIYDAYYGKEQFVRVLDKDVCPETKWVEGSNYVDVNFKLDPRTNRVIMMGAMDNLVKGAAGQAVQNMNLMFGFAENEGLQGVPMFP